MAGKRIVIGDTEIEIPDIGKKAFIYPVLLLILVWIFLPGPFTWWIRKKMGWFELLEN